MGRLVGLISTGIVLAIEAAAEHQSSSNNARKRSNPNYQQDLTYGSRDTYLQDSEDQRDTKAFQELQAYADFQKHLSNRVQDDIMRDTKHAHINPQILPKGQAFGDYFSHQPFIHPSLQQSYLPGRLPCPVIIPQRRPEDRSPGWVRAYAPALMKCGIDQTAFLNFLDAFNESSKSSPHLDAVNVAALGAGFAPGISPVLISMAVPVAVRMAKTMQTETNTISFLSRANNELFIPRGLFAMLMIHNPSSTSQINTVDISQPTSYETTHQVEIPTGAPLIFPDADPTPIAGQQNKFKKIGHFIADYSDRRAQTNYAFELLNSSISNTSQAFRSLRGDTNNPINSGDSSSLTTDRPGREDRMQALKGRRRKSSSSSKRSRQVEESQNSKDDRGLIARLDGMGMKKNVLYLIIVNNPTNNSEPSSFNNSRPMTAQTSYPFREAKRFKSPDFLEPDPFQQRPVWAPDSGVAWLPSDRYGPSAGYQTAPAERGRSPPPAYMSPRRGGGEGSRYEKMVTGRDTADEYCVPTL